MQEPPVPSGRRPHSERIGEIVRMLPSGKIAAVVIDDTEQHKSYYLHELGKRSEIRIVDHGPMHPEMYIIRIERLT